MIKLGGPEDSGITDPVTSRRIFVTTTARKTFRAANANWAKVRNVLLNAAIANDFARAKPQQRPFRVRKDPNSIGQVRDSSNGRYIAIIGSCDIKVVAVMGGVPMLRPPAVTPAPVQMPESEQTVQSAFKSFLIKHAADSLGEGLEDILILLSEETGVSINKLLEQISGHPDKDEIIEMLKSADEQSYPRQDDIISTPESTNSFITHPSYEFQGALPSSALALQSGTQVL
jgi:hypothetical protein